MLNVSSVFNYTVNLFFCFFLLIILCTHFLNYIVNLFQPCSFKDQLEAPHFGSIFDGQSRGFMMGFIQTPSTSAALCALCVYTHKGKLNFMLCVHVCACVLCLLISNLSCFDGSPWIWPLAVIDKPMDLVVRGRWIRLLMTRAWRPTNGVAVCADE